MLTRYHIVLAIGSRLVVMLQQYIKLKQKKMQCVLEHVILQMHNLIGRIHQTQRRLTLQAQHHTGYGANPK